MNGWTKAAVEIIGLNVHDKLIISHLNRSTAVSELTKSGVEDHT